MVPRENGRCPQRHAENHDRGPRAQAADCAMALGQHRRSTAGRRLPAGLTGKGKRVSELTAAWSLAFDDAEVAVTLHRAWLSRRGRRMGPPPRNFADDAHGCITVSISLRSTEYKLVAR